MRAWVRLIAPGYAVDLRVCPRRTGALRIIAFIEQPAVIEKILTHLGMWAPSTRRPPGAALATESGRHGMVGVSGQLGASKSWPMRIVAPKLKRPRIRCPPRFRSTL